MNPFHVVFRLPHVCAHDGLLDAPLFASTEKVLWYSSENSDAGAPKKGWRNFLSDGKYLSSRENEKQFRRSLLHQPSCERTSLALFNLLENFLCLVRLLLTKKLLLSKIDVASTSNLLPTSKLQGKDASRAFVAWFRSLCKFLRSKWIARLSPDPKAI